MKKEKLCCYYCLAIDIRSDKIQLTGSGDMICPHCSIDSVKKFETWEELYIHHVSSFHTGYINSSKTQTALMCNHSFCSGWNKLLTSMEKKLKF